MRTWQRRFYQHSTLTEGESMNGAALQFTRSSLDTQTGLPLFLVAFYRFLVRRHGEATSFLLRVHGPYLYLRDDYHISISSSILFFLRHFLLITTTIVRKKITNHVSARALVLRPRAL